jgi:hypothetical protein
MVKRVGFVEIKRNTHGLYEACQSLETANIRAFLKVNGIESSLYVEKKLSSINDVAEDILSVSDEILIFKINESASDLNKVLINVLMEFGSPEIYLITEDKKGFPPAAHFLGGNPESELMEILTGSDKSARPVCEISPYEEKTLLLREIADKGIYLGSEPMERIQNAIEKELKMLRDMYDGADDEEKKDIIFHGAPLKSKEELEALAEKIKKWETPYFTYHVPAGICALNDIYSGEMYENIKFIVRMDKEPAKAEVLFLKRLLEKGKISGIEASARLAEKNSAVGKAIGEAAESGIQFYVKLHGETREAELSKVVALRAFQPTRDFFATYSKGHLKSRIGMYADMMPAGKVHHLIIDEGTAIPLCADDFNELMSVNSSVLIEEETDEDLPDTVYFDSDGIAHTGSRQYAEFIDKAVAEGRNPSNLIRRSGNSILVNDLAYGKEFGILRLTYSQAKENIERLKNEKDKNKITLIRIDTENDFKLLLEDAESFKDSRRIASLPLAYALLENACRFLGKNQCSVSKLPRMHCRADGSVSVCESSSDCFIEKREPFGIMQNYYVSHEKAGVERDCYKCKAHDACAGCSELPGYMKNDYCGIITERPYVLDYICLPHYLERLRETISGFADIDGERIRISTAHMVNLIDEKIDGGSAEYLYPFTACIICGGRYVLWSPVTNKYYRVSREFAVYIELLLRRVRPEEAVGHFAGYAGVDYEEAAKSIVRMNMMLSSAGAFMCKPQLQEAGTGAK